jgi:hypothetical protein
MVLPNIYLCGNYRIYSTLPLYLQVYKIIANVKRHEAMPLKSIDTINRQAIQI